MVSANQSLCPIEAHSNYKLVGQSFGSFVSTLETLAHSTGILHSPSVWKPRTKSLSTPACCPFSLGHQQAKPAQQQFVPSRRLWECLAPHAVPWWWLRTCSCSDFCESDLKDLDPRLIFLIHLLCWLTAVCLQPLIPYSMYCMYVFFHKILGSPAVWVTLIE